MYNANIPPSMNKILADAQSNQNRFLETVSIAAENKAEIIASKNHTAITDFQSQLPNNDDVALSIVQFGSNITLLVYSIGYIDNNLIVFYGTDNQNTPMELIQHINQLSFLITTIPKTSPEIPKRKIGFEG